MRLLPLMLAIAEPRVSRTACTDDAAPVDADGASAAACDGDDSRTAGTGSSVGDRDDSELRDCIDVIVKQI